MQLTGNPFVDNGLCVMAHLSGRESVQTMTWTDVSTLVGDGMDLARTNTNLKSFTMVFGTNGPLTQPAYKKIGKNETIYTGTLRRLLAAAETEGNRGEPCELTGIRTTLDFHEVCSVPLRETGQKVPESKWIGRDWVPLGGSLGNDAQALPSASRPLHVCATALLALQYLPRCLALYQGLLACYQSTHAPLVQNLVSDLVEKNRVRLGGEILGKGEGSRMFVQLLLGLLDRLQTAVGERALPDSTSLQLWLFSNSGAGANCRLVEIPDYALRVLWKASAEFGGEIDKLLTVEPRDPRYQFLQALTDQRDYSGLYPFKKWQGASQRFYEFYQTEVCRRTPDALRAARAVGAKVAKALDRKALMGMRKPEAFRDASNRNRVRRVIADALTPDAYDALFPTIRFSPILTDFGGWGLVRFYLNLSDIWDFALPEGAMSRTTHPKIQILAQDYMNRKTPERVKTVLAGLARGRIGVAWLRNRFCEFAEMRDGYTYEDWRDLATDEEGRPVVNELLFQFRLELANLYRASSQNAEVSHG